MNKNQEVKNNDLSEIDGSNDVNLDALDKEYTSATNKIFGKIKYEINNYDGIQKNNRIVSNWRKNEFNDFVSTLRNLKIELPSNVSEQYFQENGTKKVIEQIEKINMSQEYKKLLEEKCWFYRDSKNTPKENKIEANDFDELRKYVDVEKIFTQRFKCLIMICKNEMYSKIHDDAKKLLEQIFSDLKRNGLMFNKRIKDEIDKNTLFNHKTENKIDKDMIKKYESVVSEFYEANKSKINKIFLEAAKIKNKHEVKAILERLEEQDKIQKQKEEEERKKQEELKQKNDEPKNEPKDESKMEKNDNNEEKNNNKKTNKKDDQNNIDTKNKTDDNEKNNEKHESNKESSSTQKKTNNENKNMNPKIDIEQQKNINERKKQRIIDVAESSYFQNMLYADFLNYQSKIKQNTLETANIYTAFRNLSLNFVNLIKKNYLGDNGLSFPEYQQNQEIDEFLIQYLRDDKFHEFKFQNKPIQFKNYGYYISYSYYDEISAKTAEKSDNIAKTLIKEDFVFNLQEFRIKAGATGCSSTNDDCFIWALLSHISLEELEDIKKFVDKNRKCSVPAWNSNLELSKDNSGNVIRKTCNLFSYARGAEQFISDQAKIIAYVRAALAIKIVQNQADKLETKENWEEFLTLLGIGPTKNIRANGKEEIVNWHKRDVNGNGNMVAQAVVDLTQRPFLLIYNGVESGYLLRTTTHIADGDNTKTEFGLQLGTFSFNSIYSSYNNNSNLPSESFPKAQQALLQANQRLLCLIDDKNVISVKLDAGGNVWTGSTSGHFYAIGRNYTGETLTTQKNNDVFNKFNVERDLKSNSTLRKNLDQLGFAEKNKNMPSCYFLANGNNFKGLEDIINFLQTLDSKNIEANFDKWFKNILCSTDGKIDENNFTDRVNKFFYSQDKNKELYKGDNKALSLREAINNFSSYVPLHFHSKWFRIINNTFSNPALFFKNTVIEKLEKLELGSDNGMKYFGYLIGKFIESVADQQNPANAYDVWKQKFINSDYLENILTCKNDIENDFLSEVKENKFIGYNNQDVVNNLLKFIRLFDPSDLYVLIGVVEKEKNCDAVKPLYCLSPKTVSKLFNLFREFMSEKEKNQNEIKKAEEKKENENDNTIKKQDNICSEHINLIKLLGEINSKNPNGILDKIISDSKSFEELNGSLKTIKSIVNYGNDAKNFLFDLDFESFKKVLGYFKQEQEKEKKENEKKEGKQESLWDFIKNKKYDRDDIQKIVSVSNGLDEIKNNFKSLNDTVKIDQCKICQQENKTGFWNLFTGIKNSISKIFSLFQKNDKNNINVEKNIGETSLEFIASAIDKDGDEGENARIMFYTMSKNMGSEKMKQLWTKVEEYMKKKKGNNEKPKQKEEEINTNTK